MIDLAKEFRKIFNHANHKIQTFFAPGRINLIGEHTDYNGGHVFPAAISFGTYAVGKKRNDSKLRFYSMNFPEIGIIECDLNDLAFSEKHNWANYPKGMIKYVLDAGYSIRNGADILFYGDIPNGAGLSSSASIEMVTGVLLENLFQLKIDRIDMVRIGQKVENHYLGVNSGIMDQFAIGMGKKDNAILLDCQSLAYDYAPIKLDHHAIMIINTNKQRTLAGSKYNERRQECEKALADLQTELPIKSLGELTADTFHQYEQLIENPIHRKRAKHAITENERTLNALHALRNGNLEEFGALMNASHRSLRDDYEVTGPELDTIAEAAWRQEGVIGARMTGAGFGGCAIAIVENDKKDAFQQYVNQTYQAKFGYEPTFYTAAISDGAKTAKEQ
ncbi:galactokinase [Virgibacillus siamensis]|uniref:galactokinase n=1 Tax=Virgibacillus siamensis TaxID=480071 RepID=UPI00098693CB|nr:galactokinase [Virgibacillus siamensis]